MYVNIKNIDFYYQKNQPILSDVSLHMKKNQIVALLGKSGSGKSTLLRIICGLERPKRGTIIVNQKTLVGDQKFVTADHRNIGMVFQDYALFPHMSVYKNIAFGLHGYSKEEIKERVDEVLELVNLPGKANRYPHELSGGEQQRIALARSIATKPDVLLLDEPFSNLDADLKHQIRDDLRQIIKKANITCLFVTHDMEDAKNIADEIISIEDGHIIQKESVERS